MKSYENPIWHIHEGFLPENIYPIDFSTLINLVTALEYIRYINN